VSHHQRQLRRALQLVVVDVEVGAADAAGLHRELDLPRTGLRLGELGGTERRARLIEDHRAHPRIIAPHTRRRHRERR